MATKAEKIFNDTRMNVLILIDEHHTSFSERWRLGSWCYGDLKEEQQFLSQRTLNAIKKLIEKEERHLDRCDKYGISEKHPERASRNREAVRVLNDMVADTQKELDREKEERNARKSMSYDDFMAKYYPQYA